MPLDRSKLPPHELEMLDKIVGFGIPEADAEIIASCILTRKPCSWMDNEFVEDKKIQALRDFIAANNYPLILTFTPVSNRSNFIWEVKIKK